MAKNAKLQKAVVENPNIRNGPIKLSSLKDKLVRYRLSGPLSQAILSDLFKEAVVSVETGSKHRNFWWQNYYEDKSREKTHAQQWQKWKTMKTVQSPAELPPHNVLALTVRDPRIFLPPKKKMVTNSVSTDVKEFTAAPICRPGSPDLAVSPLWLSDVRLKASEKMTEQEFNQQRSRLLIPGSLLDLGEEESRVPVLLIHRPDHQGELLTPQLNKSNIAPGFGSGWDIILPSGWGMAFWISLVYRGARVGGTREAENLHRETRKLYFPSDFPDTNSGKNHEDFQRKTLEEKHSRYPPAKRPNFVKFGIPTPFYFPWKRVLQEWREYCVSNSTSKMEADSAVTSPSKLKFLDDIFVLREKSLLQELWKHISGNVVDDSCPTDSNIASEFLEKISNALVSVRVTMVNRGTPGKFDSICLATEVDLKSFKENPNYGGPVEPPHKDFTKETDGKQKKTKPCGHTPHSQNQTSTLKELKLPEENLLNFNSRRTIGYLISGAFSLCQGHGAGLGFCSAIGLSYMKASSICLIRPQNSLQYRFVRLEITI